MCCCLPEARQAPETLGIPCYYKGEDYKQPEAAISGVIGCHCLNEMHCMLSGQDIVQANPCLETLFQKDSYNKPHTQDLYAASAMKLALQGD